MVSIIIPVYNCEKYIEKCVKSVLDQSYEDLEIIIIDDGSNDKTLSICKELSKNDKRIRIIQQENKGVSCARNQGLMNVTGEYVIFIDGDDWVEKNFVECLLSDLLEKQVDLVACGWICEDEGGLISEKKQFAKKLINTEMAIRMAFAESGFQGYLWNKIFKRELICNNNLFFDSSVTMLEDLLFVYEYLSKCKKIVINDKLCYHHVIYESSSREKCFKGKNFDIRWLSELKVLSKIIDNTGDAYLKKFLKSRKVLVCGFYLKRMYECNYYNSEIKKKLKKYIRNNLYYLWRIKTGNNVWRLTTTLSGFSIHLERWIHHLLIH